MLPRFSQKVLFFEVNHNSENSRKNLVYCSESGEISPSAKKKVQIYILITSLDICLKQIEVYEVLNEISHELAKYFRGLGRSDSLQKVKTYVTFTS